MRYRVKVEPVMNDYFVTVTAADKKTAEEQAVIEASMDGVDGSDVCYYRVLSVEEVPTPEAH